MNLRVIREPSTAAATMGLLLIDGVFTCWTLEDVVREVKIPGETAIPAGRYDVRLSFSQRFQKTLPELLAVPNFKGIRIHAGNTAQADTAGCLLVGRVRAVDRIEESKLALMNVMEHLRRATTAGDPITITIEDAR
jgi:hypothetical protein